jgi:hypothetical protein
MFDASCYEVAPGAWARPCGRPGPYYLPTWTGRNVRRLEVLTCTRPPHPAHEHHEYARWDTGMVAKWAPNGQPIWPPPVREVNADGE